MARSEKEALYQDAKATLEKASSTFLDADVTEEEREELQRFAFISLLSFDVYMKKQMIELLIDQMSHDKAVEDKSHSKKKGDKKSDKKNP